MEYMGGVVYKRYRVFARAISGLPKEEETESAVMREEVEAMLSSPCI
jgi:hypothetical protein